MGGQGHWAKTQQHWGTCRRGRGLDLWKRGDPWVGGEALGGLWRGQGGLRPGRPSVGHPLLRSPFL